MLKALGFDIASHMVINASFPISDQKLHISNTKSLVSYVRRYTFTHRTARRFVLHVLYAICIFFLYTHNTCVFDFACIHIPPFYEKVSNLDMQNVLPPLCVPRWIQIHGADATIKYFI